MESRILLARDFLEQEPLNNVMPGQSVEHFSPSELGVVDSFSLTARITDGDVDIYQVQAAVGGEIMVRAIHQGGNPSADDSDADKDDLLVQRLDNAGNPLGAPFGLIAAGNSFNVKIGGVSAGDTYWFVVSGADANDDALYQIRFTNIDREDDGGTNNNTLARATDLGSLGSIAPEALLGHTIHQPDRDYFRFAIPAVSPGTLEIHALMPAGSGAATGPTGPTNLGLRIRDASGLAVATSNGTTTDVDTATLEVPLSFESLTYYAEIYSGSQNQVNRYDLEFEFRSSLAGVISGFKFEDVNGDGLWDDDERPLADVRINLDWYDDGSIDVSTQTDVTGFYEFGDVPFGTHRLTEEIGAGVIQTLPGAALRFGYSVAINDVNRLWDHLDFGNALAGAIHGYKFLDRNSDGSDDGEPRLANIEFLLEGDLDSDGLPDSLTTFTDSHGEFHFPELPPGTYTVSEIPTDGLTPTTPDSVTLVLVSGEVAVSQTGQGDPLGPNQFETVDARLAFGNFALASIHGYKFNDLNMNGVDDNDPGLPGITIQLWGPVADVNGDGFITSEDALITAETSPPVSELITDSKGEYAFENLFPGMYLVAEVPPPGSIPTTPTQVILTIESGEEHVAFVGQLSSLSPSGNVNVSQLEGIQDESVIVTNPLNPLALFAFSNNLDGGLFAARSLDGGATWLPSGGSDFVIANGGDLLVPGCCDPTATWDIFGNLFISYLDNGVSANPIAISTDGGISFVPLASVGGVPDQPTIVTGPGPGGLGSSVWLTWNEDGEIVVAGAAVSGLGAVNVGLFTAPQPVPGMGFFSFGDIAVGPSGQLVVTAQNNDGDEGPDEIRVATDPDGLGPAPFGPFVIATDTNVGDFDFIPAQSDRSVDAESGLGFDFSGGPFHGRLYLVYADESPNESDDHNIFVRTSNDDGLAWSPPVRVNQDSGTHSQFLPKIAVDPTSGAVGVCWYDARNDLAVGSPLDTDSDGSPNSEAQFYCSASLDGGATWVAETLVSDGVSDEDRADFDFNIDYGDYSGLLFLNSVLHPLWADNSNSTGDNPNGATAFDLYTDTIQLRRLPPFQTEVVNPRLAFGNLLLGSIDGEKFEDLNGNGNKDVGEPGLPDWTITLSGTTILGASVELSTLTQHDDPDTPEDEAGRYAFTDLFPGTYAIREVLQDGWRQSAPEFGGGGGGGRGTSGSPFSSWESAPASNGQAGDREPGVGRDQIIHPQVAEVRPYIVSADDPANHVVVPGGEFDGVANLDILLGSLGFAGCTGSLLATGLHVLTAAHCVAPFGLLDALAATATFHLPEGDVAIPSAKFFVHPDWNGDVLHGGDLAIIQLAEAAPPSANRYDIYRASDEVGRIFTKVGYGLHGTGDVGATDYDGLNRSGENRYDTLADIFDGVFFSPGSVTPGTQLAFDFDNGLSLNDALDSFFSIADVGLGDLEVNAAPGDSGGPNFIDGQIAGVTSWGIGFLGEPDVTIGTDSSFGEISTDMRVSVYAEWIDHIVLGTPVPCRITLRSGDVRGCDFGNYRPGSVHGQKFNDRSADGVNDDGEPGLEDWTITLNGTDGKGNPVHLITTTAADDPGTPQDESGVYAFNNLAPGLYTLGEVQQPGWQQTLPGESVQPVTIGFDELPAQPADDLTFQGVTFDFKVGGDDSFDAFFGGFGPGQLTFVQDPSLEGDAAGVLSLEFSLPTTSLSFGVALSTFGDVTPGFVVELFAPDGTSLGVTEVNTSSIVAFTEAQFTYSGLPVGRAVIDFAEHAADRFALDNLSYEALVHGVYFVPLESGDVVEDRDFGNVNQPSSIHGFKFEDVDGNGIYEPSIDLPMAQIEFVLTGEDDQGNSVNQTTRTDPNGEFGFVNLSPGQYTIVELSPPGHVATTPTEFTTTLGLLEELVAFPGQADLLPDDPRTEIVVGVPLMFGNAIGGSIHGFKFEDLDGDGSFAGISADIEFNWRAVTSLEDPFRPLFPNLSPGGLGTAATVLNGVAGPVTSLQGLPEIEPLITSPGDITFRMGEVFAPFSSTPALELTDFDNGSVTGVAREVFTALPGNNNVLEILRHGVVEAVADMLSVTIETVAHPDGLGGFVLLSSGFGMFDLTGVPTGADPTIFNTLVDRAGGTQISFDLTRFLFEGEDLGLVDGTVYAASGEVTDLSTTPELQFDWVAVTSIEDPALQLFPDLAPGGLDTANSVLNGVTGPVTSLRGMPEIQAIVGAPEDITFRMGDVAAPYSGIPALQLTSFDDGMATGTSLQIYTPLPGNNNTLEILRNGVVEALGEMLGVTIETVAEPDGVGGFVLLSSGFGTFELTGVPAGADPTIFNTLLDRAGGTLITFDLTQFLFSGVDLALPDGTVSAASGELSNLAAPTEPGLAGIEFSLTGVDGRGNPVSLTTSTDINGDFWFEGLPPGTYTVAEVPSPLYVATSGAPFTTTLQSREEFVWREGAAMLDPDDPRHEIVVGESLVFGNLVLGSIHGFKFEDVDGDGHYTPGDHELLINGSFETGDFTGWQIEDLIEPFFPLTVGPSGITSWFEFFTSAPTDGEFAALHGFDGSGPGRIRLAQEVSLPAGGNAELTFDYRAAWDLINFGASLDRLLDVNIEDLGGANLSHVNVLTALAGTYNSDTGNLRFTMDVSAFAGSTIRIALDSWIPEFFSGPAFMQIDNVSVLQAFPHSDVPLGGVEFSLTGVDFHGNPVAGTTTTDADGQFRFEGLLPGTYTVDESVPAGFVPTRPTSFTSSVQSGEELVWQRGAASLLPRDPRHEVLIGDPLVFGNTVPGSIHGFKYRDVDSDGAYTAEVDEPWSGVEFHVTGTDGLGNSVNRQTFTDENGKFAFEGLLPSVPHEGLGTGYTVSETPPVGSTPTTPPSVENLPLFSRQELVAFEGQAGLSTGGGGGGGGNGGGEVATMRFILKTFDAAGTAEISDISAGETFQLQVWVEDLRADAQGVFAAYLDVLYDPALVELAGPVIHSLLFSFGTHANTSVAGVIDAGGGFDGGLPPIGPGQFLLWSIELTALTDGTVHLDGEPTTDPTDPGDVGQSPAFDVGVRGQDLPVCPSSAISGCAGEMHFVNVTLNDGGGSGNPDPRVEVVVGTTLMFGNAVLASSSISGQKFEDLNGNGVKDHGEPGLADWTIVLQGTDESGNPVNLVTVTAHDDPDTLDDDETGRYIFDALPSGEILPTGAYHVSEELQSGWVQSLPGGGRSYTVLLGSGESVGNLDFGNFVPGSIHGFKYRDVDRDGIYTSEVDQPWSGVEFLISGTDGLGNPVSRQTFTDQNGEFGFEGLFPSVPHEGLGTGYTVSETPPLDSAPTTPPSVENLPLLSRQELVAFVGQAGINDQVVPPDPRVEVVVGATLMFGNAISGSSSISGEKFEDLNGNGVKDEGEPGLADWTIVLQGTDAFGNSVDRVTFTAHDDPHTLHDDETGRYVFDALPSGEYHVSEEMQSGWVQSLPGGGIGYTVLLGSGELLDGLDFGNFTLGSIHGLKFEDLNGNGLLDGGEPGLVGITILLDMHGDGSVDAATTTLAGGEFGFRGLQPGLTYVVTEIAPSQSFQMTPNPPPISLLSGEEYVATAEQGQQLIDFEGILPDKIRLEARLAFGNTYFGSVHGFKFDDLDGDGVFEHDDHGVQGVTFVLRGVDGLGHTIEQSATTDLNGEFHFEGLSPSVPGHGPATGYSLFEISPAGSEPTTSPEVLDLSLASRQELVWRDGAAGLPVGDPRVEVNLGQRLMFGNFTLGAIHGYKFRDLDADGSDHGEPRMADVTITLTEAGPDGQFDTGDEVTQSALTSITGDYVFVNLHAGLYRVREQLPHSFVQTTSDPADIQLQSGEVWVATSGQAVLGAGQIERVDADLAFGNIRVLRIEGRKFQDLNADGTDNDGQDPGLGGIGIELWRDGGNNHADFGSKGGDDVLAESVTTAVGTGHYQFVVQEGVYHVREQGPLPQTIQTAPSDGHYTFHAFGDFSVENADFGNHHCLDRLQVEDAVYEFTANRAGVLTLELIGGGTFQVQDASGNAVTVFTFAGDGTVVSDDSGQSAASALNPNRQRADLQVHVPGTTYQVVISGANSSTLRVLNAVNVVQGKVSIEGGRCGELIAVRDDHASATTSDAKRIFVGLVDDPNQLNNGVDHEFDGVEYNAALIDSVFGSPAITQIEVLGQGGDDFVRIGDELTQPAIVLGGEGRDRLRAGGGAATMYGGTGNDLLVGGFGADTLNGDDGDDDILGLAGADRAFGGNGADRIAGGSGDDPLLRGGNDNDQISGGLGADRMIGDTGFDTIFRGPGDLLVSGENIITGPDTLEPLLNDLVDNVFDDAFVADSDGDVLADTIDEIIAGLLP